MKVNLNSCFDFFHPVSIVIVELDAFRFSSLRLLWKLSSFDFLTFSFSWYSFTKITSVAAKHQVTLQLRAIPVL